MSEPKLWTIYYLTTGLSGRIQCEEHEFTPPEAYPRTFMAVDKSAYDRLKAQCADYEQALERYARAAHYCEGDAAFDVLAKYRGSE